MGEKGKCGRKKIFCTLGEKRSYSFSLYPIEFQRMKIEFEKIKKDRPKYYVKERKKEND